MDGHGIAHRHVDAGIIFIESLHSIRPAEDDGCIALAGNAGIVASCPCTVGIDTYAIKYHGGTVGDGNLHVIGQLARQNVAVLRLFVFSDIRKVDESSRSTSGNVVNLAGGERCVAGKGEFTTTHGQVVSHIFNY